MQPVENYSEWRLFYFISFLLLVGFFVLNMFVGVVVENFHKCRESQEAEEKVKRAEKRAKKMDKKRRSMREGYEVSLLGAGAGKGSEADDGSYCVFTGSGCMHQGFTSALRRVVCLRLIVFSRSRAGLAGSFQV